uniref:Secreted protein n=1 Tax=Anguilla anguilla TaxID=7936 RepID=A0A0E9QNJ6_ANGAN
MSFHCTGGTCAFMVLVSCSSVVRNILCAPIFSYNRIPWVPCFMYPDCGMHQTV